MILNIQYSGKGSLANPITEKHVYLPSNFGWIPTNQATSTHFVFNEHYLANSLSNASKAHFKLTYEGKNKPDYINLKETGNSVYEGEATGITFILGSLTQRVLDDKYHIFYPASWFSYDKEIIDYLNEFEKMLTRYNHILQTNYKLPNEIILLPSMAINDSYMFTYTFSNENHIIIQLDPVELTKKRPLNTAIPYQINIAFSNNKPFNKPEQFSSWLVFNSFLGGNLSGEFEDTAPSFKFKQFQQSLAEPYIRPEDKKTYSTLLGYSHKRLPDKFLVKWKQLIEDDIDNDWKQLEQILKTINLEDVK